MNLSGNNYPQDNILATASKPVKIFVAITTEFVIQVIEKKGKDFEWCYLKSSAYDGLLK